MNFVLSFEQVSESYSNLSSTTTMVQKPFLPNKHRSAEIRSSKEESILYKVAPLPFIDGVIYNRRATGVITLLITGFWAHLIDLSCDLLQPQTSCDVRWKFGPSTVLLVDSNGCVSYRLVSMKRGETAARLLWRWLGWLNIYPRKTNSWNPEELMVIYLLLLFSKAGGYFQGSIC